jgi:hypothetical protein
MRRNKMNDWMSECPPILYRRAYRITHDGPVMLATERKNSGDYTQVLLFRIITHVPARPLNPTRLFKLFVPCLALMLP